MKNKESIKIIGGGLSGCLLLAALKSRWPQIDVRLHERSGDLCGNHTWSFHDSDIPESARSWLFPFISASWSGYSVRFPGLQRSFRTGYHSICSEQLARQIRARFGDFVELGREEKATGNVFLATGWPKPVAGDRTGYQKFVGIEISTARPHGIMRPVLMDATVRQKDGYRFFYLLPWSETELLVEDTYYSNGPDLALGEIKEGIAEYLHSMGISGWTQNRLEQGVLPLPMNETRGVRAKGAIGAAAGIAHPVTGYTVPLLLRQIEAVVGGEGDYTSMARQLERAQAEIRREARFFYFLNRMLFQAAEPAERWKVLARFYGLNEGLIHRFYQGRLTLSQKARILVGRPPVPIAKAIRQIYSP